MLIRYLSLIDHKLVLMISILLASIFELAGISLVYPIIYLIFDENYSTQIDNIYFQKVLNLFDYNINFLIFIIIILISSKFIFLFIYNSINMNVSHKFLNNLRKIFFKKLFESRYDHNYGNSSLILNILTSQSKNAQSSLSLIFRILQITLMSFFLFILGLIISYKLFLLSILFEIFIFIIFKSIVNKSKLISKKLISLEEDYLNLVNQSNSNYKFIKITNTFNYLLSKIISKLEGIRKENLKYLYLKNLTSLSNEPILIIILVSIFYIGINFFNLNFPILITLLVILYRFNSQIFPIFSYYQRFKFDFQSFVYINSRIDSLSQNQENINSNLIINEIKNLEIIDASFGYNKTLFQIKYLKLERGTITTIKGISGSGKTTLIDSILNLIDIRSGSILYNQKNLNDINFKKLRSKIGYLGQDNSLFNETIYENINLRKSNIDNNIIYEYIEELELEQIFENNQIDLSFMINESKDNLSGGEKQRIAFIREISHNPDILIIDEAFNSLDKNSYSKVEALIKKIKKNMIIINIAHHDELKNISNKIYEIRNNLLVLSK